MSEIKASITKNGYTINKSSLDKKTLKSLRKDLTVKPKVHPDFELDDSSFEVFIEDDLNIYIPRYYGVEKFGDARLELEPCTPTDIQFNGIIRSYQVDIIEKCTDTLNSKGGGLISLSCGLGKTVIAINLACKLKVKTLVLVHTGRLLEQWMDRVKSFTNANIGIIRQKKIDIDGKDIVIGMLQSVSMKDYGDIFGCFGLLICDEAHHFPSRVFSRALQKITTKYTISLSATPERKDGLTKILHWYTGDLMYRLIREADSGVIVNVINYESSNKTKFSLKKRWINGSVKPDTTKMTSNICLLEERNMFISNAITHLRRHSKQRQILVLSGRIEQLEILKKMTDISADEDIRNGILEEGEYITSLYIGRMKDYELDDAVKANVLFATYSIAKEGLDIDTLNTLIIASPIKDVVQASGRILRKTKDDRDVVPMIIDIADEMNIFKNWSKERFKYYNSNKYTMNVYRAYDCNVVSAKKYLKIKGLITSKKIEEKQLRKLYISYVYGQVEYEDDAKDEISLYEDEYKYKSNFDFLVNDD